MRTQTDDENIVNILQKVNYLDIEFYHLVIIGISSMIKLERLTIC